MSPPPGSVTDRFCQKKSPFQQKAPAKKDVIILCYSLERKTGFFFERRPAFFH
jgi:hypothetical protein